MIQHTFPESFAFINRFRKYEKNPILRPCPDTPGADCVFNPGAAVSPDGKTVMMLCRCIDFNDRAAGNNWSVSTLTWARSTDGLHFQLDETPFLKPDETDPYKGGFEDPRLVWLPDEKCYMLTYTGVYDAHHTPGMAALSADLVHWDFLGEVFPARAAAVTDRRIRGKYYAYYGNSGVGLAWSDDLRVWHTDSTPVLRPRAGYFDAILCEPACAPLISADGILLIYNGAAGLDYKAKLSRGVYRFREQVDDPCYSIGWALFDRNDPRRLIARAEKPFIFPEHAYELYGIAEYTTFGEGMVTFGGKHFLYYGCSDTRIAAAIAD